MSIASILVDQRQADWIKNLTFGGVSKSICMLDAGDSWIACDDDNLLCIEDKSPTDFLNSMRDGRLLPQMARIREVSPWAYLLIRGVFVPGPNGTVIADNQSSGWNWSSLEGILLTIQEIGVNVIQIESDQQYEQAIIRLANRDRSTVRIAPPRDATLTGTAETILASLPGIGVDRAQTLLQHCGTVAAAITYITSDDKHDIPGIGYQTKTKIRKALGLNWDEALELTIRDKDERGQLKERVA